MKSEAIGVIRPVPPEAVERFRQKKIVIIGAGASGLMCAACFPRYADITVLEQLDTVGKKLLATGNGRCNLTNMNAQAEPERFYHGGRRFAGDVLRACPPSMVLHQFGMLGLDTVPEPNGLVYPVSYQAKSVQHILEYNCRLNGVAFRTGCAVKKIEAIDKKDTPYRVITEQGSFHADYVVLACGGKSGAGLGSDGGGYALARQMGHTVTPLFPALVQLKSSSKYPKKLKGTRIKAKLSIEVEGEIRGAKEGEILFTDYGLSGICTMELSRFVSEARLHDPNARITAVLDLLPRWENMDSLKNTLKTYVHIGFAPEMALTGQMPLKLAEIIAAQAGNDVERMAEIAKHWRLIITDTLGFPYSQVTCGGVATEEVDAATMESKLHPSLYLLGELLDVDGDCGGYNLQFAWASGILAAKNMTETGLNL